MTKKRILFVDDEKNILDGIRRMLHPLRSEWEVVMVTSGEEALNRLSQERFDVVVSDMRMPGMDGAQLLYTVSRTYPDTVRIVLTGHSEVAAILRAVPVAHQYLSKPCDPATLKDVIAQTGAMRDRMRYETVRRLVGGIDALPSCPQTFDTLTRALLDPDTSITQIADIASRETALAAKLLQVVNSAYFGVSQKVMSVHDATLMLGIEMIRDLALSIEAFHPPAGSDEFTLRLVSKLHERSVRCALLARQIQGQRKEGQDDAFTAALLHDIGLLVAATRLEEPFRAAVERARSGDLSLSDAEVEIYGVNHGEIGAYLLGLWGLPYSICMTAAFHHRPSDAPDAGESSLAAVHIASALVDDVADDELCISTVLDAEYVERIGLADSIEKWRASSAELDQGARQ